MQISSKRHCAGKNTRWFLTLEVGVSLTSPYLHGADKCVVHFSPFLNLNPPILLYRTFEELKWNVKCCLGTNKARLHGPRAKALMKDAKLQQRHTLKNTCNSKRYTPRRFIKQVLCTCTSFLAHAGDRWIAVAVWNTLRVPAPSFKPSRESASASSAQKRSPRAQKRPVVKNGVLATDPLQMSVPECLCWRAQGMWGFLGRP